MNVNRLFIVTAVTAFAMILLSACSSRPDFEDRAIPSDQSSFSGVIEPLAQIDIYQEGTHELQIPDGESILIQSPSVNLTHYVGKSVRISGEMTAALGNARPVFKVSLVELEGEAGEAADKKPYENKLAGLRFEIPGSWELFEDIDEFSLRWGGQELVTVRVITTADSLEVYTENQEKTPATSVTIGNQSGLRYAREDHLRFYVSNPSRKKIYQIDFTPPPSRLEEGKDQKKEGLFYEFLDSIRFLEAPRRTGKRCGGPANLKCDEGFRCEFETSEKDVAGICVPQEEAVSNERSCPFVSPPLNCVRYEPEILSKRGCPLRYRCLDSSGITPESGAAALSAERLMEVFSQNQKRLIGRENIRLIQFEISAASKSMAVVYQVDQKLKTLFSYSVSGTQIIFSEKAHFEWSTETEAWIPVFGQDLQTGLAKEIISVGEPE